MISELKWRPMGYDPIGKTIWYMNLRIEVPEYVNYIAIDSDGDIWGYEYPPVRRKRSWEALFGGDAALIGEIDLQRGTWWGETMRAV